MTATDTNNQQLSILAPFSRRYTASESQKMISKLKKLEAKLSFVDVEDLYTLTIYSSDLIFIRYLQKFILHYAEYFNISEIFKDNSQKKQSFVSVLIQKLFESVQWIKVTYLPAELVIPSRNDFSRIHDRHFKEFLVKRKVIFNICEALRICFREMVDFLTLLQHSQLLYSLTFVISQRFHLFMDFHRLVLSAYRTYLNALNKSPDRIEAFLLLHEQSHQHPYNVLAEISPLERFIDILYNRMSSSQEALAKHIVSFSSSLKSSSLTGSDEKGSSVGMTSPSKLSTDKSDRSEALLDSEWRNESKAEAKDYIRKDRMNAKALVEEERDGDGKGHFSEDRFASREEVAELILDDLDFPRSHSHSSSAPSSSSNFKHCEVQMLNYVVKILYMIACQSDKAKRQLQSSTALLHALIYRLSRSLMDESHSIQVTSSGRLTSSAIAEEVSHHAFLWEDEASRHGEVKMRDFPYSNDNFTLITTISKLLYLLDAYSLLEEDSRGRGEGQVAVDNDFVDFFVADHQLNYRRKRDEIESMDDIVVRMKSENSIHVSVRSANSNDHPPSPSNRSTASERHSRQALNSLPAIDLLNFIVVTVLTIGPYDCSLYLTDAHQENISSAIFYTGNLIHCEEAMLQLLMLSSDRNFREIFHANSAPALLIMTMASSKTSRVSAMEMARAITSYRQLFLSNSLVRILILVLQRTKSNNVDLQEKSALITPILIAIIKVLRSDERSFHIVKRLIFPKPFDSTATAASNHHSKEKGMHPQDCPENSLRHALIQLMTSLDTNLKRCVAECLFLLCHENKEEFMFRTGFGNAIALLQTKGLF